jgi:uracil-DNA glycosylase
MFFTQEICSDLGHPIQSFSHGDLSSWCHQGIFLLNAVLTVRSSEPASHQKKGWEEITDGTIRALSRERQGVVFLLWGKFAQEKSKLIDLKRGHKVLIAAHPSGLSANRGFFGCKHFSQANSLLEEPIDWRIN